MKNLTLFTLLVITFLCCPVFALEIEWDLELDDDYDGRFLTETEDHGFLILGTSQDFIITRLNSEREFLWYSELEFPFDSTYVSLRKLLKNDRGNYVIVGITVEGPRKSFFYEFDDEGNFVTYDSLTVGYPEITDVILNSHGNFYTVVGLNRRSPLEWRAQEYTQDYELVSDNLISRPVGGLKFSYLTELEGGGYFVSGSSSEGRVVYILRRNGSLQLQRCYGNRHSNYVRGIKLLEPDKYALWGHENSAFVSILNEDGHVYPDSLDIPVICRGSNFLTLFGNDKFLLYYKLDYTNDLPDSLNSSHVLSEYTFNCDSLSGILWHPDSLDHWSQWFDDMIRTHDGGALILTGKMVLDRNGRPSRDNTYLIKIAPPEGYNAITQSDQNVTLLDFELAQAFPNPFNHELRIMFSRSASPFLEVSIYDALGKLITTLDQASSRSEKTLIWSPENLSSGTYFLNCQSGNKTSLIPVIYLR